MWVDFWGILQTRRRWGRRSGISSACETGSTQLGCEPTEPPMRATGRPQARIGMWWATGHKLCWWAWRRHLFSTVAEPLRERKPTGSCTSIAWRAIAVLVQTGYKTTTTAPIFRNLFFCTIAQTNSAPVYCYLCIFLLKLWMVNPELVGYTASHNYLQDFLQEGSLVNTPFLYFSFLFCWKSW